MYLKFRIILFIFSLVVLIMVVLFQYHLIPQPVKLDQLVARLRSELPEARHALNNANYTTGVEHHVPNNANHSTGVGSNAPNNADNTTGVSLPISYIRDLGKNKLNVFVVIIVSTAPVRRERRDAIRQTWWRHCHKDTVPCHFFTDGLVVDKKMQENLLDEAARNRDMEFQALMGGREFGLRFLYHMKWVMANYNFQYFFRLDDDYFVCLQKVLHELTARPTKSLCWGFYHCKGTNSWMDEAWMIFSLDIIEVFMAQNARTMLCHPHADQQIGMWLNNISQRLNFHDNRLIYNVNNHFNWTGTNVCDKYIGVHQAYSSRMVQLHRASGDGAKDVPPIADYFAFCRSNTFDYKRMGPAWFYEPRPCVKSPSWHNDSRPWIGKEGMI